MGFLLGRGAAGAKGGGRANERKRARDTGGHHSVLPAPQCSPAPAEAHLRYRAWRSGNNVEARPTCHQARPRPKWINAQRLRREPLPRGPHGRTFSTAFWLSLLEIAWLNLLLSGDNAIVIAMATRRLAPETRRQAILWGVVVAVGLRVTLTLFAAELLQVGGLRLLGALLLLWIGVALCGEENSEAEVGERDTLLAAIRTILFADLATGLDNVVAVAAVADASASGARSLLVACGLGLSIPIVIFGSGLMVQLVRRLPALVMLGGALLGGVAGKLWCMSACWRRCEARWPFRRGLIHSPGQQWW